MDESFGTAPETNVKSAPSISPNSEDDKESAKKWTLLDNEQPSTNDAPQQKVDDKVNPAVQFESLRTLSDEKLAQAKQDLDDMEKKFITMPKTSKTNTKNKAESKESPKKKPTN